MSTNVDPKLLAAVAVAQGVEDNRPELNGVFVTRHMLEGLLIVATNGHIITVAHDKTGVLDHDEGVVFEISPAMIDTLSIIAPPVDLDELLITIDKKYIDWSRVIPDFQDAVPQAVVGYRSDVFDKVIKTCDALGDEINFVTFGGDDASAPVLVRYSAFPNLFSVIMPCKPEDGLVINPEIPFMIL
jgi:hypothetical protein